MLSKQDISLENAVNEPPLFSFILVVHGGGSPGTGSVWGLFRCRGGNEGFAFIREFECTLVISQNFSSSHQQHK